ncbi:MAG TPA: ABC transporter ATP-binding protein [Actinomycetota bacterium]
MTASPLLRIQGLTCSYGAITALRGVDLDAHPNEVTCVLGVNGAGKSTLLAALAGAIRPSAGSVRVGEVETVGTSPERMVGLGVVLVPEGRQVFPSLTVRDNLLIGAYRLRRDRSAVLEGLDEVRRLFPILGELAERPAGALSGGEQQMLAIGRALMGRPRVLMLDEPSLGLAPRVVRVVMEAVAGLAAEGRAVLLVEQLARVALQSSHRGYLLESGTVVLEGTSEDLQADDRVREIYMGVKG